MANAPQGDHRKTALTTLLVLIVVLTLSQLALYTGLIRFYLYYVIPPFLALIATFLCALINIFFHRFFEKHHLNLLYLATALPLVIFLAAIMLHFFEDAIYQIVAIAIAIASITWYAILLLTVIRSGMIDA